MAGPVDLKRGRCQSEERPTVGGGPGVGSPAPESGPAGGPGPSPLGPGVGMPLGACVRGHVEV